MKAKCERCGKDAVTRSGDINTSEQKTARHHVVTMSKYCDECFDDRVTWIKQGTNVRRIRKPKHKKMYA